MKLKKRLLPAAPPPGKAERTAMWVTAVLVLCACGIGSGYFITKYLPLLLCAITLLMPVLAAFPLLFYRDSRRRAFRLIYAAAAYLLTGGACAAYILFLYRRTSLYKLTYLWPVLLLAAFALLIVIEKICQNTEAETPRDTAILRSLRSFCGVTRLSAALTSAAMFVKLLGFYDLQKLLIWCLSAVFFYELIFLLLSLTVRAIRKELESSPDLTIPVPFSGASDLRVLGYLEENTGITMRSLWSLRMVKAILPYMAVAVLILFWISSGIVSVPSDSHGALYRFGVLMDEPLEPGLHLTLPQPLDKVDIYSTEAVQKITVGYKSDTNSNNTWTEAHGSEEFKLLLGGGNELVSVNLRIEYKISDLILYLRCSASPEKILEASAYELITSTTVQTDLTTLLAEDRTALAEEFGTELTKMIDGFDAGNGSCGIGIEIVSVVLESIHPPVNVAGKYQELISAEIQAEKTILQAEGYAARTVAAAQSTALQSVNAAEADRLTRVAEATSSVSTFMASVAADSEYSNAYRYYKYLDSLCSAYGKAKLVILGEDIDGSNIWLGNIPLN